MKQLLLTVLSCTVLLSPAFAADPVAQRQEVFKQYKQTVGTMAKTVKGETPYSKDEFAKLAAHLDALAQQPWQHFPAGSDKGKTDARAEIWSKPQDWKAAIDKHKTETAKLKQTAAGGDLAAIKAQFGATQKTCKACHDSFRND
ncbi:c-type cytochrome [Vogesella indigofera]|uniref:c-type cytochrome n=1 Tax=Vogesella indigofera TaxID=45465 RepID=UPI00234C3D00|nr:cytochrome c [Vogesella indigofera]MDC7703689.1 cytochrome c [Vogesella indigofera]